MNPTHHHPISTIGPLPIGMVTGHSSGGPVGIGIGVPMMAGGQIVPSSISHMPKKVLVAPDSSDEGIQENRPQSPSSPNGGNFPWGNLSLLQPMNGIGYSVMGIIPTPQVIPEPNLKNILYGMMGPSESQLSQQNTTGKEIIHCKSCTLFPPNPTAPEPTTRDKPKGCRTVFVGGLPENITDDIVREIFDRCGEITTIRMSKKNFCHIRFEVEDFVEYAIYLSGYRVRIGSNSDAANIGRLHVDYAQARDDLYEWECRQRQLQREQRHRERIEKERLLPPSPPLVVHFSDHEAFNIAEKIKVDETFMKAVQVLITWLERGDCSKRNAHTFYSMIQSTNSHIRRLLTEKSQYEEELEKAKQILRQRMQGLSIQFGQIERVFLAASHKKVWDHFTKAQRKNIDIWNKQVGEIKSDQIEGNLRNRIDIEMDFSDSENDAEPEEKKRRLDEDKNLNNMKEENDSLRCQLEASKNEVDLIKADLKLDLDLKDQQIKLLKNELVAAKSVDSIEREKKSQENCDSSSGALKVIDLSGEESDDSSFSSSEKKINERDAKLLGIISTFLHVHPFGASLDYIWSYVQKVIPTLRPNHIENLMINFPSLFRQESSGVGATLERKWFFVGFID